MGDKTSNTIVWVNEDIHCIIVACVDLFNLVLHTLKPDYCDSNIMLKVKSLIIKSASTSTKILYTFLPCLGSLSYKFVIISFFSEMIASSDKWVSLPALVHWREESPSKILVMASEIIPSGKFARKLRPRQYLLFLIQTSSGSFKYK